MLSTSEYVLRHSTKSTFSASTVTSPAHSYPVFRGHTLTCYALTTHLPSAAAPTQRAALSIVSSSGPLFRSVRQEVLTACSVGSVAQSSAWCEFRSSPPTFGHACAYWTRGFGRPSNWPIEVVQRATSERGLRRAPSSSMMCCAAQPVRAPDNCLFISVQTLPDARRCHLRPHPSVTAEGAERSRGSARLRLSRCSSIAARSFHYKQARGSSAWLTEPRQHSVGV